MDNVPLLPHIASATHETRQAMGQRVMDNLMDAERTGQLILSRLPEHSFFLCKPRHMTMKHNLIGGQRDRRRPHLPEHQPLTRAT